MKSGLTFTVAVASTSPLKIEAARRAIAELFPGYQITMIPWNAPSGVSVDPRGWDETIRGAENRMKALLQSGIEADFYVSIENGVVKIGGCLIDIAFIIVFDAGRKHRKIAISSGTPVPQNVAAEMTASGSKHEDWGNILARLEADVNNKDPQCFVTAGQVPRVAQLTQAVKIAISQFIADGMRNRLKKKV